MNFHSVSELDFNPPLWIPHLLDRPSAWWGHVPFAFWLVPACRPETLVELGTDHGVSYAAFCDAVVEAGLATRCYAIDSWKGDAHARFYGDEVFANFKSFHDKNYLSFSELVRSEFDAANSRFADGSIDLLHIDGFHTYEAVRHDFETWLPKLSSRGVVLLHDTNVHRDDFGVWQFFEELKRAFPTFEFLHGAGLGIVAVGSEPPEAISRLCSLEGADVTAARERFSSAGSIWIAFQESRVGQETHHTHELEHLSSELNATIAGLSAEREQLVSERDQLELNRQALLAERDELVKTVEALRTENKTQRAEIARTSDLVSLLRGEYQKHNEMRANLESALDQSEKTIAYMSDRYASAVRKRKMRTLQRRVWNSMRGLPVRGSLYQRVSDSVFFDKRFYLRAYPDVRAAGIDPVVHYLQFGATEGRDPGPYFSEAKYKAVNPDVAGRMLPGLEHYESYGRGEGRRLLSLGPNPPTLSATLESLPLPPAEGRAQTNDAPPASMNTTDSISRWSQDTDNNQVPATLPWPPRARSITQSTTMRRVCIFSFYDPHGVVDDYVIFFLQKLGEFAERIIFYSNGPLARDSESKLRGVVDDVTLRPNVGFDVMAYKEGLERIQYNREGLYDEVLMVNHACYGPVFPFSELFGEMEARGCDFWGVSAHIETSPPNGAGALPYRLSSNFIAVRAAMLGSRSFRQYWDDMRVGPSTEEAVMAHEARFTESFTKLGYVASVYLNKRSYGSHDPSMLNLDETLIDRNPLIECRAFFDDPRFFDQFAADLPRALSILAKTSDYNPELIWRSAVRQAELRTLNTNAALTSVVPDVRLKQSAPLHDYGSIAVCVHLYYVDMLEEILSFTDTIPTPYDFIATTDTEAKKALIEQTVAGRKNIRNVIVRLVEQNRGRDMSALFITCRDLFLDDRYSLVCRLHTKKSPQVEASRGNLFKRHMVENLLNSEGYTTNILDMFHDKPWIGVAVPPIVQISYSHLGHVWYNNRERAEELKKLLGLKAPFDSDTPVGAFGTMFWFRPRALRKLFAYTWEWSEYNAEPHHVDGSLAHVQERLICYVAQDAGYTTEQIINSRLAGWNYAMMEYKLQKLLAKLPNPDFNYQYRMLENWCAAGYPMSPVSASPDADGSR